MVIHDTALTLFQTKGYAATTVDDIADGAEVSRATVFRYYPAKEDILLAGDVAEGIVLVELAERRRAEAAGGAAFEEQLRASILEFAGHLAQSSDRLRLRWDIALADSRLLGRVFTCYAGWADDLVTTLGDDDDFRHHVVASAAIAGLYESVRRWHRREDDLVALVRTALDTVGI